MYLPFTFILVHETVKKVNVDAQIIVLFFLKWSRVFHSLSDYLRQTKEQYLESVLLLNYKMKWTECTADSYQIRKK